MSFIVEDMKNNEAINYTCLRAERVCRPVALATMVWLLPGLGWRLSASPEMAWTRSSTMDILSSTTENCVSPSTASTASGDSTWKQQNMTHIYSKKDSLNGIKHGEEWRHKDKHLVDNPTYSRHRPMNKGSMGKYTFSLKNGQHSAST